jgi:hypothetical protein
VYLPKGTYRTSTGLTCTANDLQIAGTSGRGSVIQATASMPWVLGLDGVNCRRFAANNLTFDGNSLASIGFWDYNNTNYEASVVRDIYVKNAVGDGFVAQRCQICTLENITSTNNGGRGIYLNGVNASGIKNLSAQTNTGAGIVIKACSDLGSGVCVPVMTTQAAMGSGDTTVVVDDASGISSFPMTFLINSEQIIVGSVTGNTLNITTRGANGTTAAAHVIGTQMNVQGATVFSGGVTIQNIDSESNLGNAVEVNTETPTVFTGITWIESNADGKDGIRVAGPNFSLKGFVRGTGKATTNVAWGVNLLPGANGTHIDDIYLGNAGGGTFWNKVNIDSSLTNYVIGNQVNAQGGATGPALNIGAAGNASNPPFCIATVCFYSPGAGLLTLTGTFTSTPGAAVSAPIGVSASGASNQTGLYYVTNQLFSGITSADTSIVLKDSTKMPAAGTILIDSEQITYSANNTGTNTLTVSARGANGTTAAAHLVNASVSELSYLQVTSGTTVNMKVGQGSITWPSGVSYGYSATPRIGFSDDIAGTGIAHSASGEWSFYSGSVLQFKFNSSGVTASNLLATGIVDGTAPITLTTGASATLGGTYNTGYTFNQHATAATAITYTLPTAAAGKQYCVKNSYNGSAADTGTITLQTSASGQFLISNGTLSATGGYIISAGAAGDAICAVAIDATHWEVYAQSGTWTLH